MKTSPILATLLALISLSIPACHKHEEHEEGERKVVVTTPKAMDVTITQQYVCQIHSQRHIEVKALTYGFLLPIPVKEGQQVQKNQLLFSIYPILYEAKLKSKEAERDLADLELNYTKQLAEQKAVSPREVALYVAKLAKAKAELGVAEAEYKFTEVRADYDGIIDRLHKQQGSLIKEGEVLTTLSDNSLMWVYFNVPEKQYIEYMDLTAKEKDAQKVELQLANFSKFPYKGKIATIEAKFNNETGTVPFRADFPNPETKSNGEKPQRLLRHGMTGNIVISKTMKNAIVIPQRATFEILDRRYVYVVGSEDGVVHQREIKVQNEQDNIYVISKGLGVGDKFVYEGMQQTHDGQKVEYEFRPPEQILGHQRLHAE
jgi:membrane fusion protein (multidrug efflux system)